MGKRSLFSGVQAKGTDRIEFDFEFEGTRYRPTLMRIPSEGNLRRAYKQLIDIKKRIERGTFNFQEEFPGYRYKASLAVNRAKRRQRPETCNDVFDKFIAYCEHRVSMDDMALSTLNGYREIMDRIFRPEIGPDPFDRHRLFAARGDRFSPHQEVKKEDLQQHHQRGPNGVQVRLSEIVRVSSIPPWRCRHSGSPARTARRSIRLRSKRPS